MPRPNGRHRPRIRVNSVYRSVQATGGLTATAAALGISLPTVQRWRRTGVVLDAQAVLRWAALLEPEPAAQLALAWRLAGLRPPGRQR